MGVNNLRLKSFDRAESDVCADPRKRAEMKARVQTDFEAKAKTIHCIGQLLKVPLNEDGFFLEAHMKLRPVDFATDGIFLCGLAHYPKPIDEAIVKNEHQLEPGLPESFNVMVKELLAGVSVDA